MEALVELFEDPFPVNFTLFDLVELGFHAGGKLDVDNILEMLHHQPVDDLAERRGRQAFFDLLNVFTVLNGRDNRRIRRRATNALFLHRAHQRRFGVTRGRLGEMLLRVGGKKHQSLSLGKIGQRRADCLLLVVLSLFVNRGKAREGD